MSTDLVEAAPDATFADAAQLMADRQVHHLLVSSEGRFEGMVHLDVEWSELTESLGAPDGDVRRADLAQPASLPG